MTRRPPAALFVFALFAAAPLPAPSDTARPSNGFRKTRQDSKGLAETQNLKNPYRKGLSGTTRERPGPRFAGSIPVGTTK